jgi:hypothetical protein
MSLCSKSRFHGESASGRQGVANSTFGLRILNLIWRELGVMGEARGRAAEGGQGGVGEPERRGKRRTGETGTYRMRNGGQRRVIRDPAVLCQDKALLPPLRLNRFGGRFATHATSV